MDLLEMLTGAGKNKQEYEDFANRYDQGHPAEGYSDQEVLDRYGSVAHSVPAGDYQQAAQEAYARLSPEERAEFGRYLQQRAQTKGIDVPSPPQGQSGSGFGDLGWLSNATAQLHQKPGALRDILGGLSGGSSSTGGGLLSSPIAKAALAGITASLVKRALGRR
jgi:hypothetical protein